MGTIFIIKHIGQFSKKAENYNKKSDHDKVTFTKWVGSKIMTYCLYYMKYEYHGNGLAFEGHHVTHKWHIMQIILFII